MHRVLRLTRRGLLKGAALAALAGGAALAGTRTAGYVVPAGRRLASLEKWQFVVVEQVARRVVAPDRQDGSVPTADAIDVAGFVDGWLVRLPKHTGRDLRRFLAYLEHVAPLRVGSLTRFTRLSAATQDRVLASLEASPNDLLRAGFDGLRSLVFLGYYSDPRTWQILGYDGPLVGRPAGGWR